MFLKDLIPFLRFTIDDRETLDQEYSDTELLQYLQFGIQAVEGEWEQGYQILTDNTDLYIDPFPSTWVQMLFVLKTAIMIKSFKDIYHYKIPTISITNSSIKDTIKKLEETYNAIKDEHKHQVTSFIYTTWDDYRQRLMWIMD